MNAGVRKDIVSNYIELVRLEGFEKHYPRQLSGGMQQRVAIARALANDPEILLLDEPFGALDNQTRILMQELLLEIWEKSHKTILFITHDVEESIYLANRVVVMTSRPGKIKADIPIDLEHPRPYSIKVEPHFLAYKEQLTELIREESLKAMMEVK
jgi:ABC-type nitrate/sulfonate/bicarbonate transport system ATPase subunit